VWSQRGKSEASKRGLDSRVPRIDDGLVYERIETPEAASEAVRGARHELSTASPLQKHVEILQEVARLKIEQGARVQEGPQLKLCGGVTAGEESLGRGWPGRSPVRRRRCPSKSG
jgi:hypothetical protein